MKIDRLKLPYLKTRPAKTILVQAGTLAFRVDLTLGPDGFKPREIACIDIERKPKGKDPLPEKDPSENEFETNWITTLLEQKPSPSKRVKILSTDVHCAVLEMPLLNDYNADDAVALEAEAFFNVPISDAQWSWMRLPAEDGLVKGWVSLTPIEKLLAWRNAVSEVRGSQLEAVGHPCGIRLGNNIPQAEVWPDLVLLHVRVSEQREIFGWSGKNALKEAINDPETKDFFEDPELSLVHHEEKSVSLKPALSIELSNDEQRVQWVEALSTMIDPLETKLATLPVIRLPQKPLSNQFVAAISGGVAAGMALLLGIHFLFSTITLQNLGNEVAALREPRNQLSELRKEEQTLKQELRRLQSGQKETMTVVNLDDQRARMGSLLKGLSEAAGSGIVLTQIQPDGFTVLIEGVAATSEGTLEYTNLINEIMGKDGWIAKVQKREAQFIRPGGGPWVFELLLSPVILEERGTTTSIARRTTR